MGLSHHFLQFPRQNIVFIFSDTYETNRRFDDHDNNTYISSTFEVRTNEGLKLDMDMAVHLKLTSAKTDDEKAKELITILKRYGEDQWSSRVAVIIRAAVLDVSSQHAAFDFFTMRAQIGQEIYDVMKAELADNGFSLTHSMILNLNFPAAFDAEI